MTENDKIKDLVHQNTNSRKLTNDVLESLTGKTLDWFIETLGNRKEADEDESKNSREGTSPGG